MCFLGLLDVAISDFSPEVKYLFPGKQRPHFLNGSVPAENSRLEFALPRENSCDAPHFIGRITIFHRKIEIRWDGNIPNLNTAQYKHIISRREAGIDHIWSELKPRATFFALPNISAYFYGDIRSHLLAPKLSLLLQQILTSCGGGLNPDSDLLHRFCRASGLFNRIPHICTLSFSKTGKPFGGGPKQTGRNSQDECEEGDRIKKLIGVRWPFADLVTAIVAYYSAPILRRWFGLENNDCRNDQKRCDDNH